MPAEKIRPSQPKRILHYLVLNDPSMAKSEDKGQVRR